MISRCFALCSVGAGKSKDRSQAYNNGHAAREEKVFVIKPRRAHVQQQRVDARPSVAPRRSNNTLDHDTGQQQPVAPRRRTKTAPDIRPHAQQRG